MNNQPTQRLEGTPLILVMAVGTYVAAGTRKQMPIGSK